jgi:hypothetical protein
MKKHCPKCQSAMAEGFVVDGDSNGGNKVSRWIEGAPVKGWFGLKVRGKRQIDVATYRCGRCGFLESFAVEGLARVP